MIVRYKGWPGTGLLLEKTDDSSYCLDAGGTHGDGPMTLFICAGKDQRPGVQIDLSPSDVAHLASQCTEWLAWHHSGRGTKR